MINRKPFRPLIPILAVWLTFVSATRAEQFQWKLSQGDVFEVTIEQSSNVFSSYETRQRALGTKTSMTLSWKIVTVENAMATIEQRIERVTLELNAPTQDGSNKILIDSTEIDAAVGGSAELKTQIQNLIGLTFTIKMASDGSIRDVQVPDATLAALRTAPSSIPFRQMLTPEGLKQLYAQTTFVLPADDVPENHRWTTTAESNSPWGQINIETTYTYVGAVAFENRPMARFNIARELKPLAQPADKTSAAPANPSGASEQVAESAKLVKQSAEGAFFFDTTAGHFAGGNFKQRIEAERTYREQVLKTIHENELTLKFQKK